VIGISQALRRSVRLLAGPLLIGLIAIGGPTLLPATMLDTGALCALYLVAGVGLNLLMGYTGQVSFGQGGFWAIGAYGVGVLTVRLDLPVMVAIVAAVAITGVVAFLIGWPVTQLRGHYIAVATLALALIVVDLANNLVPLTGGNAGLVGVPPLTISGEPLTSASFFQVCWSVALVVLVVAANLSRSRTGRALRAVGADESGSQALGMASARYRLIAFVFAAVLAGLSGALYATYLGFLSPEAFTAELSALFLIVIVVGGMSSPYGAVVGAIVVTVLSQWLADVAANPAMPARLAPALNTLLYGVVIFAVMRFFPDGLLPLLGRIFGGVAAAVRRRLPLPGNRLRSAHLDQHADPASSPEARPDAEPAGG
jgi:branched-chain amino acid transport system permease protein